MSFAKDFKAITDKLQKSKVTASFRAMNKAISKVRTQFARQTAQDLGVQSKAIKNRFRTNKANSKRLSANVSFGTGFGISYQYLKPKVQLVGKAKKKKLTVKVPTGREELKSSFLWKGIVLNRKAGSRYPVQTSRYSLDNYKPNTSALNQMFFDEFNSNFEKQLQYEITRST